MGWTGLDSVALPCVALECNRSRKSQRQLLFSVSVFVARIGPARIDTGSNAHATSESDPCRIRSLVFRRFVWTRDGTVFSGRNNRLPVGCGRQNEKPETTPACPRPLRRAHGTARHGTKRTNERTNHRGKPVQAGPRAASHRTVPRFRSVKGCSCAVQHTPSPHPVVAKTNEDKRKAGVRRPATGPPRTRTRAHGQ